MIDEAKFNAVLHAAAAELQRIDNNFCGLVAVAVYSEGEREDDDDDGFWLNPLIHVETCLDRTRLIEASAEVLEDYAIVKRATA